ncbi:MAG: hypothetical protein IKJ69_01790 [Clostridia bacterium]|nr:hypothetical protein [Clostridia bacterium]
MKKGLCAVLSLVMIIASFAACKKIDNERPTNINSDGDAYINVTDKDGNDVTDAAGEVVTSVINSDDQNKTDKTNKTNKNDKTSATNGNNPTLPSELDQIINAEDFNPIAKPDDLLEEGTTVAKKTTLREDVIGNAFEKKKYTLSMNIVGEDGEMPAMVVMNGDDFALSVDYQGMPIKMIIKDGKTYIAFSLATSRFYMETDEIIDAGEMTPNTEKHTYVGTSNVKDGDKTYVCEEYKTDSGLTVKYYFLGKKWVRYEAVNGDEVAIFKVNEFKDKADKSIFDLKGYTKFDMNAFANMGV